MLGGLINYVNGGFIKLQLLIDGVCKPDGFLASESRVLTFLQCVPNNIGMTAISEPKVHRYSGSNPLDWGLSGFVLIAESHISVHTFPDRNLINIDVFSCKKFDVDKVIEYAIRLFSIDIVTTNILERGLEYMDVEEIE